MSRAVLSVASECAPLVKTGGLADVVGALPGAMAPQGWALRTLVPGYPVVMGQIKRTKVVREIPNLFGGAARVLACHAAGLDLLVLDAPHLFERDGGPYNRPGGGDWHDNPERFAALSWVAAEIAAGALGSWVPEVLHVHDWQAAFAPTYLAMSGRKVPSLITVHNIAFNGPAPADRIASLRLPYERFSPEGYEFYGYISSLKSGLMDATAISTVSPTYARELTTPEFGMGLDGVISARREDLFGILNGIDTDVWSPDTDPLVENFKQPRGKARARNALLEEFGIAPADGPLCVVVTRLTAQKGLDVLLEAMPRLLSGGGMLALLGSGEPEIERAFAAMAAEVPQVGVRIGYDEALSHRMFAGGDAVLVPSRFEPCGLTQMYGLRYGAVPLVARTGGLADTVIDANDAALKAGVATGIKVTPGSAADLARGFGDLCGLFADKQTWGKLQRNGMKHPVGWDSSARQYAELYARLAG